MRRQFIPGNNSLSQSNIDTNNVCPCATNINKKVINSSNSDSIQTFTRVQKQVDIIKYSTSGRTMYGNYSPFLRQSATEYMNTVLASNNQNQSSSSIKYTLNSSINNQALGLENNLINPNQNPNIFIRCAIPPFGKCIKPLRNKF